MRKEDKGAAAQNIDTSEYLSAFRNIVYEKLLKEEPKVIKLKQEKGKQ